MDESGVVSIVKTIILNEEIKKMSPQEKKRYLMLTNILRDLNLLQKLQLFIRLDIQKEEVLRWADITMHFFFLKTLISKNHEMWEFIKRNNIIDEKSKFSQELRDYLTQIEIFFSDKRVENLFSFIRNKFGFHYEYWNDIDQSINDVMNNYPHIEMWLSDTDAGNDIFVSSNAIMVDVIFSEMKRLGFNGDNQKLFGELADLTSQSSRLFERFSKSYLIEIILKNTTLQSVDRVEIKVPLLSEVKLPLLVKNG